MKIIAFLLCVCTAHAETYKELKDLAFSESQDMSVRWKSLVKMSEMKKSDSVPDMKQALKSDTWYMRNAALLALETVNRDEAYDAAKKQLDDPALVVRSAAVDVLMKYPQHEKEVRALLWRELEDPQNIVKKRSLWIRPQIVKYLAKKPQVSERSQFLKLVDEGDEEIRTLAQKAIR